MLHCVAPECTEGRNVGAMGGGSERKHGDAKIPYLLAAEGLNAPDGQLGERQPYSVYAHVNRHRNHTRDVGLNITLRLDTSLFSSLLSLRHIRLTAILSLGHLPSINGLYLLFSVRHHADASAGYWKPSPPTTAWITGTNLIFMQ